MATWCVSGGEPRRRWAVLVAAIWIQAFTGTNFDFSAYSSSLKSVLGVSQVQLNYLAVASDMGKALGWSSGLALLRLPLWVVLVLACAMGLVGYSIQWLLLAGIVSLPYFAVFLLCLLAGCSICWFNTVCFVLCSRSFPNSRPLALSLTVSFNGVSAALYTLMANAVGQSSNNSIYLFLNAVVPAVASSIALVPIMSQSSLSLPSTAPTTNNSDTRVFLALNALAFATGLYLLLLNSASSTQTTARILLFVAVLLLVLPLFIPGFMCSWKAMEALQPRRVGDEVDDDLGLREGLIHGKGSDEGWQYDDDEDHGHGKMGLWMGGEKLGMLGEEHSPGRLIRRVDFWLYYTSYFCGATVGLVYSNNLGQITQSLGRESETTMLVSIYSACSFFGRLLSSAPDYLNRLQTFRKFNLARTGWLAMALIPMPLAFFLLAWVNNGDALVAGTAFVGLSSGFIFAAAVSVTSELFGPNSIGLNHNILITNIPLGSLLYGLLAALVYDGNGSSSFVKAFLGDGAVICMGTKCYAATFVAWGCITLLGLASGVVLFLRTRSAYKRSERGIAMAMVN